VGCVACKPASQLTGSFLSLWVSIAITADGDPVYRFGQAESE